MIGPNAMMLSVYGTDARASRLVFDVLATRDVDLRDAIADLKADPPPGSPADRETLLVNAITLLDRAQAQSMSLAHRRDERNGFTYVDPDLGLVAVQWIAA